MAQLLSSNSRCTNTSSSQTALGLTARLHSIQTQK